MEKWKDEMTANEDPLNLQYSNISVFSYSNIPAFTVIPIFHHSSLC